jgi:transcriptional regulator with XRE-family HTH domain
MDLSRKENQQAAAARMRELRQHFRHTQQECADALGITQPSYTAMERGESRIRRRDLVTISVLYGIAPEVAFPGMVDLPKGRAVVDLSGLQATA